GPTDGVARPGGLGEEIVVAVTGIGFGAAIGPGGSVEPLEEVIAIGGDMAVGVGQAGWSAVGGVAILRDRPARYRRHADAAWPSVEIIGVGRHSLLRVGAAGQTVHHVIGVVGDIAGRIGGTGHLAHGVGVGVAIAVGDAVAGQDPETTVA